MFFHSVSDWTYMNSLNSCQLHDALKIFLISPLFIFILYHSIPCTFLHFISSVICHLHAVVLMRKRWIKSNIGVWFEANRQYVFCLHVPISRYIACVILCWISAFERLIIDESYKWSHSWHRAILILAFLCNINSIMTPDIKPTSHARVEKVPLNYVPTKMLMSIWLEWGRWQDDKCDYTEHCSVWSYQFYRDYQYGTDEDEDFGWRFRLKISTVAGRGH